MQINWINTRLGTDVQLKQTFDTLVANIVLGGVAIIVFVSIIMRMYPVLLY